jgi:REP element-mobilizing transposase RayT
MGHSYTNLLYHIVFSTKDRQPWFKNDLAPRLHEYLGGTVRSEGGIPLAIDGWDDHVHILAKLRQDIAVSEALKKLKAGSSGWIHREFANYHDFAWQRGYGAFSVSQSQVEKVKEYILNQRTHHRRMSFNEELIALLDAHGIQYDARYLWG